MYDAFEYDLMIDWKKRLEREIPLLVHVFKKYNVKKILDCACGTGEHCFALKEKGFDVFGTDCSEEMLESARKKAKKRNLDVKFFRSSFEKLPFKKEFDAVLCLGNSLPHVLKDKELEASLKGMYHVLREGGILIIQVRNYDWIFKEKIRFMKPSGARYRDKEYMFFRFLDFCNHNINFNIITFVRKNGEWDFRVRSSKLRPILKKELEKFLKIVGFKNLKFYCNYKLEEWEKEGVDTVVIAQR